MSTWYYELGARLDTSLGAMFDAMLDVMSCMSMLDAILDAGFNTKLGIWGFRAVRLDVKLINGTCR